MKISINDLTFGFDEKEIFNGLSFAIEGECSPVVILGPSGCGKTTLLRLIAGLIKPHKGEISFADTTDGSNTLTNSPPVSCVFQKPTLLPHLSVQENIALPLRKIYGKEKAFDLAAEALNSVQLSDRSLAFPDELSGGQAQRAALARAFAFPSEIILMDEPFQSLDIPLRLSLMDLSLSLLNETKRLTIIVSHDPREAVYLGRRVIILRKLVSRKSVSEIVFDEEIKLNSEDRAFGSARGAELEMKLIEVLKNS